MDQNPPHPLRPLFVAVIALGLGAMILLPLLALWQVLTDVRMLLKLLVTDGIVVAVAVLGLTFLKSRGDGSASRMPDGRA